MYTAPCNWFEPIISKGAPVTTVEPSPVTAAPNDGLRLAVSDGSAPQPVEGLTKTKAPSLGDPATIIAPLALRLIDVLPRFAVPRGTEAPRKPLSVSVDQPPEGLSKT